MKNKLFWQNGWTIPNRCLNVWCLFVCVCVWEREKEHLWTCTSIMANFPCVHSLPSTKMIYPCAWIFHLLQKIWNILVCCHLSFLTVSLSASSHSNLGGFLKAKHKQFSNHEVYGSIILQYDYQTANNKLFDSNNNIYCAACFTSDNKWVSESIIT